MKIGDQIPVTIAGQTVAMAEVKELSDGSATLIVPATRVVMATRTELSLEQQIADTSGTQTIVDDVVRPEPVVEQPAGQPVDNAANTVATPPVEQSATAVAPAAPVVPAPVVAPTAAPSAEFDAPSTVQPVSTTTEH